MSEPSDRTSKAVRRYRDASHALQSGVATEIATNPKTVEPKHLRVGINLTKTDQAGLVRILIGKGLFTEEEYLEAIAQAAEDEVKLYETRLTEQLGRKVHLL